MLLKQIHDPALAQYAYLIGCPRSGEALIIDPERDVDRYLDLAKAEGLRITAAAETHIHADFLSGTRQLVERHDGIRGYLSREGGDDWQYRWASSHDRVTLLADGDHFHVGGVEIRAWHCPGHTPEHLSFLVIDRGGGADEPMALISGDFMFVGDVGRPDLLETAAGQADTQERGARDLFASIGRFARLPEFVMVLPGHGAGSSCGKALGAIPFSTVGYETRTNGAVRTALDQGEDAFLDEILRGQPEPPMYFARMKTTNRDGAGLLDSLPDAPRLSAERIAAREEGTVFIDIRSDRNDFMNRHLAGSVYAPAGPKFSEAVGSYVEPGHPIVLLVERTDQVDDCVRQLVRIGLDNIAGHAVAGEFLGQTDLPLTSTPTIQTTDIDPDRRVLDVRSADEFASGHVPGAHHLAHTRLVADRDRLPAPGPLTVHCGSGLRAALATAALERLGFEVTFADGSFGDWKESADRVATGG